jgi:hypothetical protein
MPAMPATAKPGIRKLRRQACEGILSRTTWVAALTRERTSPTSIPLLVAVPDVSGREEEPLIRAAEHEPTLPA